MPSLSHDAFGTELDGTRALAGTTKRAEEDREQLAARLRTAADRANDQLADGLEDYGKGG